MVVVENKIIGSKGQVIAEFRSAKRAKLTLENLNQELQHKKETDMMFSDMTTHELAMRLGLSYDSISCVLSQMNTILVKG